MHHLRRRPFVPDARFPCDSSSPPMVRHVPSTIGALSGSPRSRMEAVAVMAGTKILENGKIT